PISGQYLQAFCYGLICNRLIQELFVLSYGQIRPCETEDGKIVSRIASKIPPFRRLNALRRSRTLGLENNDRVLVGPCSRKSLICSLICLGSSIANRVAKSEVSQ